MADPHTEAKQQPEPPDQTPLLASNHNNAARTQQQGGENEDAQLDHTLEKLETFLSFLGFNQSSVLSFCLSWVAFVAVGVLLPVLVLEFIDCSDCEKYQIKNFEIDIVATQACLAGVSLLCLSHNLRKYGIRRFIFVDRYRGRIARFSNLYIKQISDSVRLLVMWSVPCFILKAAREIIRTIYAPRESWWLSIAVLVALVISWTYLSTVCLSASMFFHLVCNLQVIHFEDYAKLLERESDVLVFIEEHIRLRHHLSKISHRFRIFLLLEFLVVTAGQVVTLFQTTGGYTTITFINGGDFAVSSVVQVVGISLCLHAATKISHRAQGISSIASRWHALATCGSTDGSQVRGSNSSGNLEALSQSNLSMNYSESDLESADYFAMPTTTQLASYMSSYHRRQAFVIYLQTNPGGITIFGWTVDRALINTIFFIELSLVTFVLGKTLGLSSA